MHPLPISGGPLYAISFWTVYMLWIVLETIGSLTHRSNASAKSSDKGSYRLLLALLWTGLGLAFALAFALPQAAILWRRPSIFFIGIALILAGLAFRFYSMHVLGRFFMYDVATQVDQRVIDAGPYRLIRHPSYSGAFITLIGIGLALGNWAGLFALLACTGIGYAYRISVEEAALIAALGAPYRQYMHRTRRIIPFLL